MFNGHKCPSCTGWPERASQCPLPSSYCSIGNGANFGRDFSETHFRACIHAGIPISGQIFCDATAQPQSNVSPTPTTVLQGVCYLQPDLKDCSGRPQHICVVYQLICFISPTGYNSEETRGQWSYKIGPCRGVEIGDHLWLSRYILLRCSEQCGVKASFHAKPVPGDWNGNGAFVKFSTALTRGARNVSTLSQRFQLMPHKFRVCH